jgi:hypothetical protein
MLGLRFYLGPKTCHSERLRVMNLLFRGKLGDAP